MRGGVLAVMAAYNSVNGSFAAENRHLLVEILQEEWGFLGLMMSDWAATHGAVSSALGGLDLEMPYGPLPQYPVHYGDELREALDAGEVPAERLDDIATRVLTPLVALNLLNKPKPDPQAVASRPEHALLARKASAGGTVLLKNTNNALPLGRDVATVAVIGSAAHQSPVSTGGGSALVKSSPTHPHGTRRTEPSHTCPLEAVSGN